MFEERATMLLRLLNVKDTRGRALEGAVHRLQQWVGCEEPVLETDWMRCRCVEAGLTERPCGGMRGGCKTSCGWSGTWIGMLYMALGDLEVKIEGGEGMPKRRRGDKCLVDMAELDERDMVRMGCMASEIWRCSEALQMDGRTLSRALDKGGSAEKTAGRKWCDWARAKLGSAGDRRGLMRAGTTVGVGVLGEWLAGSAWSWQVIAWEEEGGSCWGSRHSPPRAARAARAGKRSRGA